MLMNSDIAQMVHDSNKSCSNSFNTKEMPTVNPIY